MLFSTKLASVTTMLEGSAPAASLLGLMLFSSMLAEVTVRHEGSGVMVFGVHSRSASDGLMFARDTMLQPGKGTRDDVHTTLSPPTVRQGSMVGASH